MPTMKAPPVRKAAEKLWKTWLSVVFWVRDGPEVGQLGAALLPVMMR